MTDAAPAPAPSAPAPAPSASALLNTPPAAGVPEGQLAQVPGAAPPAASPIPWLEGVDAEMIGYAQNKGWTDPKQVVEGYRNLEKMRGVPAERLLTLPDAAADQATKDAFYEKLGRPKTAAEYDIKVEGNDATTAHLKELFHKNGVSAEQARNLLAGQIEYEQKAIQAHQDQLRAKIEGEVTALKSEWGQAYDQNMGGAREGAKLLGLDNATIDALGESLGHGKLMKLLHSVAVRSGEDAFVTDTSRQGYGNKLSPAQAQAEFNRLRADPAWVARRNAGDAVANAELKRLIGFMSAGQ